MLQKVETRTGAAFARLRTLPGSGLAASETPDAVFPLLCLIRHPREGGDPLCRVFAAPSSRLPSMAPRLRGDDDSVWPQERPLPTHFRHASVSWHLVRQARGYLPETPACAGVTDFLGAGGGCLSRTFRTRPARYPPSASRSTRSSGIAPLPRTMPWKARRLKRRPCDAISLLRISSRRSWPSL